MTLPATSLLIIISCVTSGALIVPVNLSLKQSKYNINFMEKYLFSLTKIFVVIYLCHLCTLEKATMSATGFMWSGSPAPVSSPKFGMIAAIGPRGVSAKAVWKVFYD